MRVVLIDDEAHARNILSAQLRRADPGIVLVGTAERLESGVELIVRERPDVVFLDIEMPGHNGLQLRRLLPVDIDFSLVFVTAYDQYAIPALRLSAIDYLLKPLVFEDLCACLERLRAHVRQRSELQVRLRALEENRSGDRLEKMVVSTLQGNHYIDLGDLYSLEADGMYTVLHLRGDRLLTSKPLRNYEGMLPGSFFRIHRSHIVNLAHVRSYTRSEGATVCMADGQELPLARNRREAFYQACRVQGVG